MRVYLAHPIADDPQRNVMLAATWWRWVALDTPYDPVAPYISSIMALNDRDEYEREIGMRITRRAVLTCRELWFVGYRISSGMVLESQIASHNDIPTVDLSGYFTPHDMIGG